MPDLPSHPSRRLEVSGSGESARPPRRVRIGADCLGRSTACRTLAETQLLLARGTSSIAMAGIDEPGFHRGHGRGRHDGVRDVHAAGHWRRDGVGSKVITVGDHVISDADLIWRFTRSSGPGGQNVNTTDTRVQLSFDLAGSDTFPDDLKQRMLTRLGDRVVVVAAEHRSQLRNRRAAEDRLAELLEKAMRPPPPPRVPTKPSKGSQQRRINQKKKRGETKRLRGRVPPGLAALTLMVVVLAGCQDDASDGPADLAESISSDYERIGDAGYIDQTLTIRNASDIPVLLDADIETLDASGAVLSAVDVQGLYGADRGGQVLVPGDNFDFLMFGGADASKVRDVRLVNIRVEAAEFPAAASGLVEAVPLDDAGNELDYPAGFSSVELRNPNHAAVTVRVVTIVWNQPPAGQPQQALHVVPVSGLITVPADGEMLVEVTSKDQRVISKYASTNALSLKAYFAE